MKGWHFERYRHALAAKGIKTSFKSSFLKKQDDFGFTRYDPIRKDKVVVVDLDNTLVDVVDYNSFKEEFNFLDQVGPGSYRKLMLDYGDDPDFTERMIRAHAEYVAGHVPELTGAQGAKYLIFQRPGMNDKLKELAKKYRLVLYTASEPAYAIEVLDKIGARDLFEDVYARPFLDRAHAHDEFISDTEGNKPLTPIADRLGVSRSDVVLLDDRPDFVGPETLYRWVRAPAFLPDQLQMDVFFGNIDRKMREVDATPSKGPPEFWAKPPRISTPEVRMERIEQALPRIKYGSEPVEKERLVSEVAKPLPFFKNPDGSYDEYSDNDYDYVAKLKK